MPGIDKFGLLPFAQPSSVRPMFKSLGISATGMSAQRQRMDAIAQNIANADVTRSVDGQPFKRREVILESMSAGAASYGAQAAGIGAPTGTGVAGTSTSLSSSMGSDSAKAIEVPVLALGTVLPGPSGSDAGELGVRVVGVAEDQGEGRLVYEPGHPDADAKGYVRYPDIDTTQEQVKLMEARRIYEANVAVFQTTKSILRASLDI